MMDTKVYGVSERSTTSETQTNEKKREGLRSPSSCCMVQVCQSEPDTQQAPGVDWTPHTVSSRRNDETPTRLAAPLVKRLRRVQIEVEPVCVACGEDLHWKYGLWLDQDGSDCDVMEGGHFVHSGYHIPRPSEAYLRQLDEREDA